MEIWAFIESQLARNTGVALLYVVESRGSSPGRQGFCMAVAGDGTMHGTIGGGVMEQKWVERARDMLRKGKKEILLVKQYHDKIHAQQQSGMICSGEQTLALVPLAPNDREAVRTLAAAGDAGAPWLSLSPAGIRLIPPEAAALSLPRFEYRDEQSWRYVEAPARRPRIHIIGGGHVSLALSEIMQMLGFYVLVYDDRPGLNTLEANRFASEKHLFPYEEIGARMAAREEDYVVIMTVGYRADKLVLRQLLHRRFRYIGMLGSDAKIRQLYEEWAGEGLDPATWRHVHAPIGIPIYSKTAREIGISIAAEIIREKNRHVPGGRNV